MECLVCIIMFRVVAVWFDVFCCVGFCVVVCDVCVLNVFVVCFAFVLLCLLWYVLCVCLVCCVVFVDC